MSNTSMNDSDMPICCLDSTVKNLQQAQRPLQQSLVNTSDVQLKDERQIEETIIVLPPIKKIHTPKTLQISRVFDKKSKQVQGQDKPFVLSPEVLRSVKMIDTESAQSLSSLVKQIEHLTTKDHEIIVSETGCRVVFREIPVHSLYPSNTCRKRKLLDRDTQQNILTDLKHPYQGVNEDKCSPSTSQQTEHRTEVGASSHIRARKDNLHNGDSDNHSTLYESSCASDISNVTNVRDSIEPQTNSLTPSICRISRDFNHHDDIREKNGTDTVDMVPRRPLLYPPLGHWLDTDVQNPDNRKVGNSTEADKQTEIKQKLIPKLPRLFTTISTKGGVELGLLDHNNGLGEEKFDEMELSPTSSPLSDEDKENFDPLSDSLNKSFLSNSIATSSLSSEEDEEGPISPDDKIRSVVVPENSQNANQISPQRVLDMNGLFSFPSEHKYNGRSESHPNRSIELLSPIPLDDRATSDVNANDECTEHTISDPLTPAKESAFIPEAEGFQFTGVDVNHPQMSFSEQIFTWPTVRLIPNRPSGLNKRTRHHRVYA